MRGIQVTLGALLLTASLAVADRFPELWVNPYYLACYICQLDRLAPPM